MAKDFALAFYNSKVWHNCRKAYIASVFGLCEKCKKPGYILHHKTELNPSNINDPYITLGWDNLLYVCLECHNSIHGNAEPVREGLRFDDHGDLVEC